MYWKIAILLCTLITTQILLAEKCLTPNNETAECIPLYSCRVLISAIVSQHKVSIDFVSESNCGGTAKNPMVCCGTSANFTAVKNSTSEVSKIKLLPSNRFCGYQHADDYLRTENDTSIRITEFPWLARIKLRNLDTNASGYLCIGSLINRRYVLTAAHCVLNKIYIPEAVQLGEYNTKNKTDCVKEPPFEEECSEPVQEINIQQAIPHRNYTKTKRLHDIALIRLVKNVEFTDYIRPICLPLPERTHAQVGDTLLSTGWGKANYNKDYVEIKKKILSTVISRDECRKKYHQLKQEITEYHLCGIAFSNNTAFECSGDSGGPLMISHYNQWQQEGIISFGARCGSGYPDVYTNVKNYIEWILDVIQP